MFAIWFIIGNSFSYVIMENLRYFLTAHNASKPIYFGCKIDTGVKFMQGGAGYVLSKEALRRFISVIDDKTKCRQGIEGYEDVEIGELSNNYKTQFNSI